MADAAAADLLIRLGLDASGLRGELSARLTEAERVAVASGNRMSTAVAGGADKAAAAQLRVVAATERANRVLRDESASAGQLASAQAGLISAQDRYASAVARTTKAQEESVVASKAQAESSSITGTKHLASLALFFGGAAALRDGVHVLKEYQANLAQTAAAIASTGGVANVSSEHVQKLGEEIQNYSGQARETVIASENMLLTFTNVRNEVGKGNDVYDRATKALADLAARGFGTVQGNARALGRALQDPLSGLTLLRRSGITFTTQQQEVVKGLAESNHLLDAQKFILDVIDQKVGGAAKAYGETLPGKIDITKHSLEDVERQVIGMTEPLLKGAAAVAGFIGANELPRDLTTSFVGVTAGLVIANKAVKLFTEIRANVLRQSAAQVAANEAEAASYDTLALAAGGAAEAKTVAGVSGLRGRAGALLAGRGKLLGAGALVVGGGLALAGNGGKSVTDRAASVAGDTLLGAGIGSFIPGVGTAVGAGAGALFGIGSQLFGSSDPTGAKTHRSLSAIRSDLASVRGQINALPANTGVLGPNAGKLSELQLRGKSLQDELDAAKKAAKQTLPVFDAATGATLQLNAAQIKARDSAQQHAAALAAQRAELAKDIAVFAVDPFSGSPVKANVKSAQETLKQAQQQLSEANRAVAEAQSQAGANTSTAASGADIRAAELRLQAARARLAGVGTTPGASDSAQASVISAEQRLNALRHQGARTAGSQKGAEDAIAAAIRRQRDAEKEVNKARKGVNDAHGLSADEALKLELQTVGSQKTRLSDLRKLVGEGATDQTLTAFANLDKQTPGTIHRIATSAGRAFVEKFNASLATQTHVEHALGEVLKGAQTFSEQRGQRDGKAYGRAWARGAVTSAGIYLGGHAVAPIGGYSNPASPATQTGTLNKLRTSNFERTGNAP